MVDKAHLVSVSEWLFWSCCLTLIGDVMFCICSPSKQKDCNAVHLMVLLFLLVSNHPYLNVCCLILFVHQKLLALVRCSLGCALVRTEGPADTHAVLYSTSTPPILHYSAFSHWHYYQGSVDSNTVNTLEGDIECPLVQHLSSKALTYFSHCQNAHCVGCVFPSLSVNIVSTARCSRRSNGLGYIRPIRPIRPEIALSVLNCSM